MNEQTRYVMAIYEVGVIIRDTMEYLLPANKDGYRLDVYNSRKTIPWSLEWICASGSSIQ